jgi:hypothetical protein
MSSRWRMQNAAPVTGGSDRDQVRLTPYRSAASGKCDAHSTAIYAPLVGCSGLLGSTVDGIEEGFGITQG